jgi:hypothetical protein
MKVLDVCIVSDVIVIAMDNRHLDAVEFFTYGLLRESFAYMWMERGDFAHPDSSNGSWKVLRDQIERVR